MPTPCKTTGIGFLVALGLLLTPITATIRAQEPDRVFPGTAWATKTPEELGLDRKKLQAFAANVKGVGCVVKDGYMVYSWGDQTLTGDWASAGKPIISLLLFFAILEGKLPSVDALVKEWGWALGEQDQTMTFRHLGNMTSGYARGEAPARPMPTTILASSSTA